MLQVPWRPDNVLTYQIMTIDAGTCPTRPHFAHFNRLELSCHSDSVHDFPCTLTHPNPNPETLIPVLSLDSWHSVRECGPDAPGQCELHKGSAPCNSNNRNPGPQRQQMSWGWSLDQVYMTSMQEVKMRVGVWHGLARKLHPRVPPVSFLLNVLAPTYT